jgi:hypothetical protein
MDRSLTAAEGASRRGWWLVDKPLKFHEKASKIRCRGFNPLIRTLVDMHVLTKPSGIRGHYAFDHPLFRASSIWVRSP